MPKVLTILLNATATLAFFASTAAYGQDSKNSPAAEFAAVCDGFYSINDAGVVNVDKVAVTAKKHGWSSIESKDNTFIERRIAEWETSIAANAEGQRRIVGPFVKRFANRELILYVQDTVLPNSRVLFGISSCNMFDIAPPPSVQELEMVMGTKRVKDNHSQPYIYRRTPDTLSGVSWYDPYGIKETSITTISTRTDKVSGDSFVTYDAGAHHWKPSTRAVGEIPDVPPPPVFISKPTSQSEKDSPSTDNEPS